MCCSGEKSEKMIQSIPVYSVYVAKSIYLKPFPSPPLSAAGNFSIFGFFPSCTAQLHVLQIQNKCVRRLSALGVSFWLDGPFLPPRSVTFCLLADNASITH